MRVLHITFRYGRDVYGGAEIHMRRLSEELQKKNIDVDVCTTKSHSLQQVIKSTVLWDNSLENEVINGVSVYRFPVRNPNKYLSFILEKWIQRRHDREEASHASERDQRITRSFDEAGGLLLSGWNQLELYDAFSMRWSKGDSSFLVLDHSVGSISFSLFNPRKIPIKIFVHSPQYAQEMNATSDHEWERITLSLPDVSGNIRICFRPQRSWKPLKDIRTLSFAISDIRYTTEGGEKRIDLENDYHRFLIRKGEYVEYLLSNASTRPKYYCSLFDALRGPNCPTMQRWLERNIEKYDLVMAQMFPFNTINYSLIAKKFKKPLVVLPEMHIDDAFYHWSHYYDQLKQADLVLANSMYSKNELFDRIGAKSVCVGPGIDDTVFLSPDVDGRRFREKYGFEDKQIVLTVSRKSPSKRYDMLISAMESLHQDYPDAHLVMIGPDEDRMPIDAAGVTYLGKVPEKDLVDAYDACDAFAMMSESESFGMVFCEAWSRKKPVIGNINCGAVRSLIENGRDGYLCNSADEVSHRLESLLDDRQLSLKIGDTGFKKVVENYTWDIISEKVSSCYRSLV